MRMDKKGQFFAIYIALITLVMCGIVIGLYIYNDSRVGASLVSPKEVLEQGSDLKIFEVIEKEYILQSLFESLDYYEFGEEDYLDKFREFFISKVDEDEVIKEYLFENLYFEGLDITSSALLKSKEFFENNLYSSSGIYYEEGKIVFSRSGPYKYKTLKAIFPYDKINYNVGFKISLDKKYLITKKDNNFIVEEI